MKAQELMIGDWVQNTNGNKGKVIGFRYFPEEGINEIVVSYSENSTCWSDENMITPIPLTAEIIEKNGWDIEDACYANYKLPDDFAWLEFYFHELRLRKWWEGVDEWDNHNKVREITFQCHCTYVHELQHALRLCGLNELADNFKI